MADCGFTRETWLDKMQEIADWSRDLWKRGDLRYGNSQTVYPCSDKPIRFISCDRAPSRGLYDLGFKNQTLGGWTTENMYIYLPQNGFITITDWNKLEAGDIVEMTDGVHSAPVGNGKFHIFVVKSVHGGYVDKWDFGSDSRIQQGATFYNVPINGGKFEWAGAKSFFRAWRPNYKTTKPKEKKVNSIEKIECGIGTAGAEGTIFHLPEFGHYLLYTGHSSSAALNGHWIIRVVESNGKVVKIGGGSAVSVSVKGKDLTVKTKSGNANVYAIKLQ